MIDIVYSIDPDGAYYFIDCQSGQAKNLADEMGIKHFGTADIVAGDKFTGAALDADMIIKRRGFYN